MSVCITQRVCQYADYADDYFHKYLFFLKINTFWVLIAILNPKEKQQILVFKKLVPVNVWYFWKVFYFSFGGLIVAALEDIKTSSMSLLSPPSLRFQPLLKSAAQPYLCLQRKTIILLPLQLSGAAHTHLFVSDRWPTERSSVCVFGYRAVGQLLYLPLVTLIWLCTLTQGTFLFNQAVVFLPRPPSWKNTYFIWRADWEPRAKTRWHHGLILVAVHYMLTSGCQDKFCRILSLISLNGYFSWQTCCPPVVLQT